MQKVQTESNFAVQRMLLEIFDNLLTNSGVMVKMEARLEGAQLERKGAGIPKGP